MRLAVLQPCLGCTLCSVPQWSESLLTHSFLWLLGHNFLPLFMWKFRIKGWTWVDWDK